jgi:hypothetical protein
MAVSSGQLVSVRINGSEDGQYANVPSLWFKNKSAGNKELRDLALSVKWWIKYNMAPRLASAWELRSIDCWKLGGLQAIRTVAGGVTTYKSTRTVWAEKWREPGEGIVGSITTRPMPTFVAYGVGYQISNPRIIEYTTGGVGADVPTILPRGGGYRFPGVPEAATVDDATDPNRLTAFYQSQLQAAVASLMDIGAAFTNDVPGTGDWGLMNVSQYSLGEERLLKVDPTNQASWNPGWVASEVSSATLGDYVTSQVSRKRRQGRFQ